MSGHTPGPWQFCDDCGATASPAIRPHGTGYLVAAVNRHEPLGDDDPAGHWLANGRLLAAAPDLLAALHLAADALADYSDVNDGQDGPTPNRAMSALQEIDAVIAKAEGKPR
jgi:hypothetical protein